MEDRLNLVLIHLFQMTFKNNCFLLCDLKIEWEKFIVDKGMSTIFNLLISV